MISNLIWLLRTIWKSFYSQWILQIIPNFLHSPQTLKITPFTHYGQMTSPPTSLRRLRSSNIYFFSYLHRLFLSDHSPLMQKTRPEADEATVSHRGWGRELGVVLTWGFRIETRRPIIEGKPKLSLSTRESKHQESRERWRTPPMGGGLNELHQRCSKSLRQV